MLAHLLRERSLCRAARFGDKKLRRNFFERFSFETIFTLARVVTRHPGGTHRDTIILRAAEAGGRKQRSRLAAARRSRHRICQIGKSGAGEGIRTLDPDLGKVVLYH
jgi:hypothetical protein